MMISLFLAVAPLLASATAEPPAGGMGGLQARAGSNTGFFGSMNSQHNAPITYRPANK
jgi:hypothetical protein